MNGALSGKHLSKRWQASVCKRISAAVLWAWISAFAAPTEQPSLTTVLEALRASGTQVLYSSDLVRPDLKVVSPLSSTDVLGRAQEALAQHGLSLRKVDSNLYLVVSAPSKPSPVNPTSPDPSQTSLSEVSVYASRYALSVNGAQEPHLLSSTEIAEVAGSQVDALRATRVLPGIATNGSSRPYIRGSRQDDLLVQFDGVTLDDPFHLKDFQNVISAFDPSAVSRIEVYSGGFPVRYGTRSGGVIDITPRAVSSGYEYSIGASLAAYNLAAVGHSDGFPMDWLVTVRRSNEDALLKPLKGETGEPKFTDSLGRVRWRAGEDAYLTLGWLLLDDQIQLALDNGDEAATARYREEYGWLAYDRAFGERAHSRAVLSATHLESTRGGDLSISDVASGRLDEFRDTYSVTFRNDWAYQLTPRLLWSTGLEWALATADLEYARTEAFAASIASNFARPVDNTLSFQTEPRSMSYAVYSAARRRWSSVEAEIGVRLDAQDYRHFESHAQFSPRANLRYDVSPHLRMYGSWGRFSQAQRVDELRVEEGQVAPDAPELAVHSVLGLAYEGWADTRVTLELYRKRWGHVLPYFDNTLDRLSLLPDLQPDRVRVAPGDSESAGIELSARHALTPALEIFGSYAWSRVADEFATGDVLRSWDQPHAATVGIGWTDDALSASALAGWHRGWPRTPFTVGSASTGLTSDISLGARNTARWDNYLTLDLRAGWTVPLGRTELATWIELTNSTDRQNECCVRFVAPQSPAYSSIAAPSSWQPRIFNAGFSLRFRNAP